MSIAERVDTKLPTGTWKIDAVHSHVAFAVDYVGARFHGSFSTVEGGLDVAEDGSATLSGKASVSGVSVPDENLTKHLQTPDFFDAENAPEITFTSTDIRRSGETVDVEGVLGLRGISLPITLKGRIGHQLTDTFGKKRFSLSLETAIDRTQFGVTWNDQLPDGKPSLADEVTLTAELFLVEAPA